MFLMPIFKERNVSLRSSVIAVLWMKILLIVLKSFIQVVLLWVKNKSIARMRSLILVFLNQIMRGGNYVPSLALVKLVLHPLQFPYWGYTNFRIRTFSTCCDEKDGSLNDFSFSFFMDLRILLEHIWTDHFFSLDLLLICLCIIVICLLFESLLSLCISLFSMNLVVSWLELHSVMCIPYSFLFMSSGQWIQVA